MCQDTSGAMGYLGVERPTADEQEWKRRLGRFPWLIPGRPPAASELAAVLSVHGLPCFLDTDRGNGTGRAAWAAVPAMCSNHLDGQISARGRRNPEAGCEWQEGVNLALAWALWVRQRRGLLPGLLSPA